jgi:hypothetical protein
MNCPLPPGDCGARGRDSRRISGYPRAVLGAFGLVGGNEAIATNAEAK